ncbi:MAG: 2Fe-2S iron-sulfur cluster-binding protein [Exilibacterium sp.]
MVEYGRTIDVIDNPIHPYTKGLVASTVAFNQNERRQALKGELIAMAEDTTGCNFVSRCPEATEMCSTRKPPACECRSRLAYCHNIDPKAVEDSRETPAKVRLKVNFNGIEHTGTASTSQSLLENIENMSLPIRSACRKGLCGSCKVKLVNGQLNSEKSIVEDGYVLSCSSLLNSDAEIDITY